ncbi:MAG: HlyD family efflux transporter periplasmic adaptor subunit [Victivallales bacterium]|nr:HlyD family efflux transporter periplasmic adaptor subunit [Victivallales bacterium]
MVIKRIRKLEDNSRTVSQMARVAVDKKNFFKRMRFITLVLILISISLYAYFYMSPVKGVVLIEDNVIPLRAPVSAEIKWIIPQNQRSVKSGEKVATLFISPAVDIASSREIIQHNMTLDRIKLDMTLNALQLRLQVQQMKQEGVKLALEVQLAQIAHDRGLNTLQKNSFDYTFYKEQKERADRLWNLDAINRSDLLVAQKSYNEAYEKYKNSELAQVAFKAELDAAQQNLTQFQQSISGNQSLEQEAMSAATKYLEKSGVPIANIREYDSGYLVDVISPCDGLVVGRVEAMGNFIEKGESVVSLSQPGNIKAYAYVRAHYKDKLKIGQSAKVKMDKDFFVSSVSFIMPTLVSPPGQLVNRKMLSTKYYYLKVELDDRRFPEDVMPGQSGYVIFERE